MKPPTFRKRQDEDAKPNRAMRRAYRREARRIRPSEEQLISTIRDPEMPREGKALARLWLRFPSTPAHNIAARTNALAHRRARNKVARRSRKANR